MIKVINVGIAELKVSKHPGVLTTYGLGSCLGIALFDTQINIIGLAHVMLPNSNDSKNESNLYKYSDTAIIKLVEKMIKGGANKKNIIAKLAGGAKMFENLSINIGDKNIIASKKVLNFLNIPVISEDVGGNFARTIELHSEDGRLTIKKPGQKKTNI